MTAPALISPAPADGELARHFAEKGDARAFEALVSRHVDVVHAAALRQTGDRATADDVTQAVFLVLAKKAATLGNYPTLGGWLLKVTRFAAIDAMRKHSARKRHETAAARGRREGESPAVEAWDRLMPLLDEAMAKLGDKDRAMIVMRFFEDRKFAEMGEVMGISKDAARKKTTRAVAKLRDLLANRSHAMTAGVLTAALEAGHAATAPANIAGAAVSAGLSPAGVSSGVAAIAKGVTAMIAFQAAKVVTFVVATVVAMASAAWLPQALAAEQSAPPAPTASPAPAAQRAIAGESPAEILSRVLEQIRIGNDRETFAMVLPGSLPSMNSAETFHAAMEALRTSLDLTTVHTVAVMASMPEGAAGAESVSEVIAISNIVPTRPERVQLQRGPGLPQPVDGLAIGLTLRRVDGKWQLCDLDERAAGQEYAQYFDTFKQRHPVARYIDPVNSTPELLARRFVAATRGNVEEWVPPLFLSAADAKVIFSEGPVAQYDARKEEGMKQARKLAVDLNAMKFKELITTQPLRQIARGTRTGQMVLAQDIDVLEGARVQVVQEGAGVIDLRLEDIIKANGSWRLTEGPRP